MSNYFLSKETDEQPLGPESYGLPRDPHQVPWRRVFNMLLMCLVLVLFVLVMLPQDLRNRLNREQPSPTEGMTQKEVYQLREICAHMEVTGFKRPISYTDCRTRFSDGSTFHREGY